MMKCQCYKLFQLQSSERQEGAQQIIKISKILWSLTKKNGILESNPVDYNWHPHGADGIGMSDQDNVVHSDQHRAMLKAWCTECGVQKRGLRGHKWVVFAYFSSKGQVQIAVATGEQLRPHENSAGFYPRSRSHLTPVQDFLVISQSCLQIFQMCVCVRASLHSVVSHGLFKS